MGAEIGGYSGLLIGFSLLDLAVVLKFFFELQLLNRPPCLRCHETRQIISKKAWSLENLNKQAVKLKSQEIKRWKSAKGDSDSGDSCGHEGSDEGWL